MDARADFAAESAPTSLTPVRLADYTPPAFHVDTVDLDFDLHETGTLVRSRLAVRRATPGAPLWLDGEELVLERVAIDGVEIGANRYVRHENGLELADVPDACVIEITTRIDPAANTELSGLYVSGGGFFTQCEAQGFRRITYFPDRPDVMSRYSVTLRADPVRCPVLLSNGNPADHGVLDGRRWARWVDPHPKPSYLFALVAGDLVSVDDHFRTRSGRDVALHIWVRRGDEDRCGHAMRSLKAAMLWDEEVFGLEYDLDVFNIAAVSDFNMGAMENKGLNVFNTKYILAKPETATDGDYMGIEAVVAHEYFHNWTGNRVTCRDWFQLSLKEGLTVFRDQEFSADQGSRAVKRISDVRGLRAGQFAEDAGPLAHPVRPDSYVAIDNFYTATVYQKGAEVVRMIQTLIGREAFRRGMDLYIARHDNQAVTIEDFVAAMQDASGVDLRHFSLWYAQAGTPVLTVTETWSEATGRYALTLAQEVPPTPGQPEKSPMPIPVAMALLSQDGREIASATLLLDTARETFVFEDVGAMPVPSLLRGFSAPVKLTGMRDDALRFLAAHDTDPFVRWDSLQQFATTRLLAEVAGAPAADDLVEPYAALLAAPDGDAAFIAMALLPPSESFLGDQMLIDDVDGIARARDGALRRIGGALASEMLRMHEHLAATADPRAIDGATIGMRALKNVFLGYLGEVDPDFAIRTATEAVARGSNMTDVLAALAVLVDREGPEREEALRTFHDRWRDDPLVIDKWFSVQCGTRRPSALADALALSRHPDFDRSNPNRVRALVGAFIGNRRAFHTATGEGYRLVAETILELDPRNPQLAARLVPALGKWRRVDPARGALMRGELERIASTPRLSRNTGEMVGRSLA